MSYFAMISLIQPIILHLAAQAGMLPLSDISILLCSSIWSLHQIDTLCHSSVKIFISDVTVEQIVCQNRVEWIGARWHISKCA